MTRAPSALPHPDFGGVAAPAPAIGMGQWFTARARLDAERPALTYEDHTWRYGDLLDEVERLATLLQDSGVGPGTRVAFLGLNHPRLLTTLFATTRLGAIFVPLNFRLTGPELLHIINDAGAHTLIVDAAHAPVLQAVRNDLVCSRYWLAHGQLADDIPAAHWPALDAALPDTARITTAPVAMEADDVAVLMYTSGTTGRPKGAMLTHGNFWWNHVNEVITVDVTADDVLLVFAPLYHIGALNVLTMSTLLKGGHLILHRQFDPGLALRDMACYRVSTLFVVPAMLLFLSQHPDFATADLQTLRMITCGGAPCPEPLLHLFQGRGIAVQQGYGLTETAALVTILTSAWATRKLGSVGQPPVLTEVRVIDGQGEPLTTPGARGELCVRGQSVTRGYWNQPQATANAIDADGWFRTGDIGYQDEDGFWYVCDRLKDMIITGGENVYPAEVESVLYGHPAVAEVAVVGAPDATWGESVVAVLALKPEQSLSLEELQAYASEQLARYKVPRRLQVVPALPRNPTGKILKYLLREQLR